MTNRPTLVGRLLSTLINVLAPLALLAGIVALVVTNELGSDSGQFALAVILLTVVVSVNTLARALTNSPSRLTGDFFV